MRNTLKKAVRLQFESELKRLFDGMTRVKTPDEPIGTLAYQVDEGADATSFVILIFSPKDDSFAVELAWSRNKQLPKHKGTLPDGEYDPNGSRFRMSLLWKRSGLDVWYDLRKDLDSPDSLKEIDLTWQFEFPLDDCMRRVPAKVERSIAAIKEHGVPYLRGKGACRA